MHDDTRTVRGRMGALGLILVAGILAAGCVSTYRSNVPATAPRGTVATRAPVVAAPRPAAAQSAASPRRVGSATEAPAPAETRFDDGPDDRITEAQQRLISLWGDELIERAYEFPGRMDGSANLRQISFAAEGTIFDPDVDRSGRRIAFASTQHRSTADLYVKDVNGTAVTQLTSDPAHDVMPAFDPAGERIAFASDRSGNWDVYVMSAGGGRPVQITTHREPELHPTWSPDGRRLVYCRFGAKTGRWEIWEVDVENPTTPSFLTFGVFPQWSPDVTSNKILFQRARERGSHFHSIWTIDYVNGEARRPTEIISAGNAALINPSWSPDGRRITFVSVVEPASQSQERPARSDVWVLDLDGTRRINLTNGEMANYQPVWATTGTVYFVSNRSGIDNIWAVTTTGTMERGAAGAGGVATVETDAHGPGGDP